MKKKAKKTTRDRETLPETVYVQWDGAGDDKWLCTDSDAEDALSSLEDNDRKGRLVGRYQLVDYVTLERPVPAVVVRPVKR